MMMRGSKEQHDELFKQTGLAKIYATPPGVQVGNTGEEMGGDGEGTAQARLLHPNPPTAERMSTRARCRFDSRIGGWRRVY